VADPAAESPGYRLMREHEVACERESAVGEPDLVAVLRDTADCIVASVHALDGLDDLTHAQQAVCAQVILGARSARIFVGLALTGHYESAMAIARMLIDDGVACAYLAGHPKKAALWIEGKISPKYGDMASAVMKTSAEKDDPSEAAGWQRADTALREMRKILDDMSHANPARFKFVRTAEGYLLYPFFDRDALQLVAYFAGHALVQVLTFARKLLADYGKEVPKCNTEVLRERWTSELDRISAAAAAWAASTPARSTDAD
jgi:hypothetical protein